MTGWRRAEAARDSERVAQILCDMMPKTAACEQQGGIVTEVLTSAQMRGIEAAAMDCGRATGWELMARAGRSVVAAAFELWPVLAQAPGRAVVLCGPGNNGGDGYVAASAVADWGWKVDVYALGDVAALPRDAARAAAEWQARGTIRPLAEAAAGGAADLVIDAVFGTGLTRPLEGALADLPQLASAPGGHVVSVDLPSGLCSDSGRVLGAAVRADLTVSFHRPKAGHYLGSGPALCGTLAVADIGLTEGHEHAARLVEAPLFDLDKVRDGHKYGHGHALVLAGGPGKGGAGRLAARAALRVGAGLVTLVVPPVALAENAARLDAIMLSAVPDSYTLRGMLRDERITSVTLGMGLGGQRAREMVPAALSVRRPVVLDADALTIWEGEPELLLGQLHPGCVLTPHPGEFARLFPDLADRLAAEPESGPAYSRLDAVRAAAERAGCVVLLKGPDTVIAAPDGMALIHAAAYGRAAPWLATAGAGDVLAGLIGGLMARGAPPLAAAATGAWLHVEAARAAGPGLIAEDLPEILPRVLAGMLGQD